MDLTGNFFALFGLPVSFDVDVAQLTERYRTLQRAVHPDRFASAAEPERRLSVQQAALINDAYNTLKSPLARARYLLGLKGVSAGDSHASFQDGAFLTEQMDLREALETAQRAPDRLADIVALIATREQQARATLREGFQEDTPEALTRVAETIQRLQFYARLLEQAEELEARFAGG